MTNFIISTIRFGAVVGVALFVCAGEAFAMPVLTPPTAFGVSQTSATLSVKAVNPVGRNTTVWLEWGDTPMPNTSIGMRDIFNEGYVEGYLRGNLQPGKTYYFRGAAMEGGVTVYTPVSSFTTKSDTVAVTATTVVNTNTTVNTVNTVNTNTQTNTNSSVAQTSTNSNSGTKATGVSQSSAKAGTTTRGVSMNTSNGQSAAVINTNGVLPGTLIGWVALLIFMLLAVTVSHMIYVQNESRKKKVNPYEDEKDDSGK